MNYCCRTISHNCCSTHRTGVVGEWLQSCDGQASAAGSGGVDDGVCWTAFDKIADDDTITLWGKRRWPSKVDTVRSHRACNDEILGRSTGSYTIVQKQLLVNTHPETWSLTILFSGYTDSCCRSSSNTGVSCDATGVVGEWLESSQSGCHLWTIYSSVENPHTIFTLKMVRSNYPIWFFRGLPLKCTYFRRHTFNHKHIWRWFRFWNNTKYESLIVYINIRTFFFSCYSRYCCWTISFNSWGNHKADVFISWYKIRYNDTVRNIAISCFTECSNPFWRAVDIITYDDTITLWRERRMPRQCETSRRNCNTEVCWRSTWS